MRNSLVTAILVIALVILGWLLFTFDAQEQGPLRVADPQRAVEREIESEPAVQDLTGVGAMPLTETPYPELKAQWIARLTEALRKLPNAALAGPETTAENGLWYYDGSWGAYQALEYLGSESKHADVLLRIRHKVNKSYRQYVIETGSNLPGWRVFPHGLRVSVEVYKERESLAALKTLWNSAPFRFLSWRENGVLVPAKTRAAREVAYMGNTWLEGLRLNPVLKSAEQFSEPIGDDPRGGGKKVNLLDLAATFSIGHINQWRQARNNAHFQPFMVGLAMEFLIQYAHAEGRPSDLQAQAHEAVLSGVNMLLEEMSSNETGVVVAEKQTFRLNPSTHETGQDTNMLIAPAFAYAYKHTGNERLARAGDTLLEGAVRHAYLGAGKQLSQNLRGTFKYFFWRANKKLPPTL